MIKVHQRKNIGPPIRGNDNDNNNNNNNNNNINNNNEEDFVSTYFDFVNSNSLRPALVVTGLGIVLVTILVVVIAVPPYGGTIVLERDTTTYPPLSTTIAPTTTTISTTAVTTTPAPALILTCPTTDVPVPLGFPLNNVSLGGVSVSGGCQPLSLTYTDTLVGSIAKKKRHTPIQRLSPSENSAKVPRKSRSIHAIDFGQSQGEHCVLPKDTRGDDNMWKSSIRTTQRSPSYPSLQMSLTYSTIFANSGAPQPNPAVDVNLNYIVTATDSATNSTTIRVYTKSIVELSGSPFELSSLAPMGSVCSGTGAGQGQVLYDTFANIWLFLEPSTFANQTTFCLYASDDQALLTANYVLYPLVFPSLNGVPVGFPKLASFNGYYALSFVYNNTSPMLVIIDRDPIVTRQNVTTYFTVPRALPDLVGINTTTWTPLDNRGGLPVPQEVIGNGVFFMRQRDDSLNPAAPLPIQDYLDVIQYENINFNLGMASASSYSIPLTNFDSSGPSDCIPTPGGGGALLYAGQEWLGGRLSFTALSPPYSGEYRVVGTFVTEACTGARVQWFELTFDNVTTNQWIVRQQGVSPFQEPADQYLWMPAIAQDKYGNMVLTYSNSSTSSLNFYPSLGAYSRTADDPLNTMRYSTGWLIWAIGQSPSPAASSWGYTGMVVADPGQPVGRSFVAIGTYSPGTQNTWQGLTGYIRIQGEIIQRNVVAQDVCGQLQTCEFFILDGGT